MNEVDTSELKPCANCGGEARLLVDRFVEVVCVECPASTFAHDSETAIAAWNTRQSEGGMRCETVDVRYNPAYPHFGLIEGPIPHDQHPNQRKGLDLYVRVVNFDTGETCFKKLYENKSGLHFKHTGYSAMYLNNFTETATVIPFQVRFGADPDLQTAPESMQESMRAEIERLNKALKTQAAAVRTLRANEETELNRLREERKKWHGAISTLDSERAANTILTAEIDRMREALRGMIEGYAWEAMARRDNASDGHPEDDACVIQARQALADIPELTSDQFSAIKALSGGRNQMGGPA